MRRWENLGWVNIQHWARDHLGIPVRATTKGNVPIDHVFLSPELAVYLKGILVDDTYFADHAILSATLEFPEAPPLLPRWYQPKAFDWKSIGALPEVPIAENEQETPTTQMRSIFAQLERQIQDKTKENGSTLPPSYFGRANTFEVSWIPEFSRPPKKGRHCDPQPTYHGINAKHAQWMRQLRRLSSYQQMFNRDADTVSKKQHREALWHSISKASGFSVVLLAGGHMQLADHGHHSL